MEWFFFLHRRMQISFFLHLVSILNVGEKKVVKVTQEIMCKCVCVWFFIFTLRLFVFVLFTSLRRPTTTDSSGCCYCSRSRRRHRRRQWRNRRSPPRSTSSAPQRDAPHDDGVARPTPASPQPTSSSRNHRHRRHGRSPNCPPLKELKTSVDQFVKRIFATEGILATLNA